MVAKFFCPPQTVRRFVRSVNRFIDQTIFSYSCSIKITLKQKCTYTGQMLFVLRTSSSAQTHYDQLITSRISYIQHTALMVLLLYNDFELKTG